MKDLVLKFYFGLCLFLTGLLIEQEELREFFVPPRRKIYFLHFLGLFWWCYSEFPFTIQLFGAFLLHMAILFGKEFGEDPNSIPNPSYMLVDVVIAILALGGLKCVFFSFSPSLEGSEISQ
jgi:hypothetical protein